MGMGTGTGVIFENRYGCRYSSTRPIVIPIQESVTESRKLHAMFSLDDHINGIGYYNRLQVNWGWQA